MQYRRLFVCVEGPDDERFVARIVKPVLEKKYDLVQVVQYAEQKKEKFNNLLRSFRKMGDYLCLADMNDKPCTTATKQAIQGTFKDIDTDRIVVVIKEIEGWYLAGLDEVGCKQLRIPAHDTTDHIAKEDFDRLIPKRFDSRIDFMSEILKFFSLEIAKQKNRSFGYFLEKHDC